jgi:L-arabinokinase
MNPSYPIVFYVSGHGFGHTSRSVEVIHAVLRRQPAARIVVKTSAPRRLFERTLAGRIEFIGLECDPGMIQIDSLNIDIAGSVRRAKAFQQTLRPLAASEAAFLRATSARLVVGDIPPLAFAAATAAGIPSIAIGNFTWDWIYEGYPEESPSDLADEIRRCYRSATRVLRLPMAGGFTGLEAKTIDIPFIARRSRRETDDVRGILGLPPRRAGTPLVLMSFGGYGVEGLNSAALGALDGHTIATTDLPASSSGGSGRGGQTAIKPAPGILFISEEQLYGSGLRYEDLVRAADVVATKPGYGIVSEAIANDTALLYTSRGRFAEYDVFVREMPRYLRVHYIDRQDLLAGNWAAALEKLLNQPPPPEKPEVNGAEVAAEEVLSLWQG